MIEWVAIITVWFGDVSTVYTLTEPVFPSEVVCKQHANDVMRTFMMALASKHLAAPNGSMQGKAPRYDFKCEVKGRDA